MFKINRLKIINSGFIGVIIVFSVAFHSCQDSTTEENGEKKNEEINPDVEVPALIGTRGKFRSEDHENVIPSLSHAPPWVEGVYINVRMTSDGVPVLMHDATVDRTTDGTGAVSSLTLEEIQTLDAGDGAQVPTLEEYLKVILNREMSGIQKPLARIFMNPNDSSPAAITAMYTVAMDSQFESLADRYTWQFGNLLNNDTGAKHLRTIDDSTAIGTFLSDADKVKEMMDVLEAVGGRTILLWPGQYNKYPEALQTVADNDFEGGLSRTSSNNLNIIPVAHKDPNVKVLFTWYTDELSWWHTN